MAYGILPKRGNDTEGAFSSFMAELLQMYMEDDMNLTEIFNQENKREEVKIPFPFEVFQGEKIENSPELKLTLTNLGKGKVLIAGKSRLKFVLPCDRCLKPVEQKVELEFEREVLAPELIPDEDTKEDQHFVDGYELDLEVLLAEELQLSWPSKILCDEGCKGICKKCGKNLNEGSCGCDDFVPDVRLANLMDIFNAAQK